MLPTELQKMAALGKISLEVLRMDFEHTFGRNNLEMAMMDLE